MSSENNDWRARTASFTWKDLALFFEGVFICGVWFAFIVTVASFFGVIGEPYREHIPILDALYFVSGFIILSTIIVVSQFNKLNNSLKEIKKAIEDKQPVIIQKRVSASEQDKK